MQLPKLIRELKWHVSIYLTQIVTVPKLNYRFNTIPVIIPSASHPPPPFFAEIGKAILKFRWKHQGPRIAETNLKRKKKVGGFRTSLLQNTAKL